MKKFAALMAMMSTALGGRTDTPPEAPTVRVTNWGAFLFEFHVSENDLPADWKVLPKDPAPRAKLSVQGPDKTGGIERLRGLLDLPTIKSVYLKVFQSKGRPSKKIGVYGWEFTSANAAQVAYQDVSSSFANDATQRHKFWLVGDTVVWLWGDPGTTTSFDRLNGRIQKQVDAFMEKR